MYVRVCVRDPNTFISLCFAILKRLKSHQEHKHVGKPCKELDNFSYSTAQDFNTMLVLAKMLLRTKLTAPPYCETEATASAGSNGLLAIEWKMRGLLALYGWPTGTSRFKSFIKYLRLGKQFLKTDKLKHSRCLDATLAAVSQTAYFWSKAMKTSSAIP